MLKRLLQRLIKFTAYSAAGVVILLAVLVGLFRLFLPRLPEYQEEIKGWASAAIGMQVEFDAMDARWGLRGPELKFYEAELIRPSNQTRAVAASEVGVGVSLVRLLADRTLVVDTVTVKNTSVEVRQLEDGSWRVQGSPVEELFATHTGAATGFGTITVIADNVELQLIRPGDERPTFFDVSQLIVSRDPDRTAVDADVGLPEAIGRRLSVSARQMVAEAGAAPEPWNLSFESGDIDLSGLSELLPEGGRRFGSGRGSVDLALAIEDGRVASASTNIDFTSVTLGDGLPFDISGRIETSHDDEGWLIAADEFRLSSPSGEWPESTLRFETSTESDGEIVMVDARASYLNLEDVALVVQWLNDEQRSQVDLLRPTGIVRDLEATISDIGSDNPNYSVSVTLEGVGIAAFESYPGLRGLSGELRADRNGGRAEIDSEYMYLSIPAWLSEPVDIDAAKGTVIWRRRADHLTILSDSIAIRNSILESQSNIEITIDGDNAPVIDLASNWMIDDVAAAKRYIPENIMAPQLYSWFQNALVSGSMPRGSTLLTGPLDKFPFDGGEGRLLVEASVRDMTFRYLQTFPAAELSEMQVVLDNTRLYTESNRSVSRGNTTIDAKVEIADLREPVLTIDSYSTGTLESLQRFAADSPIANVFGGQLDRVTVSGDASMNLELTIPLKRWREFDFRARILGSNGTFAIEGLRPPVTELSGAVTIERELVTSESLGGRFMGEPVAIELRNATADMSGHRVIAAATGVVTAEGLVNDLGVPLEGRLDGAADYTVEILFPNAKSETPAPLSVRAETDLAGLGVLLPAPFEKPADEPRPLSGQLDFMPGFDSIESRGATGDLEWNLAFTRLDEAWDFDRGVLLLGGADAFEPETRGLHIRGKASVVPFADWLALSRTDDAKLGVADRVRSIEVDIGSLYILGQHLVDHRVRVDRSARDWLVQVEGEHVTGSVFVPYDFSQNRALVLDMERLVLPGDPDATEAEDDSQLDPRNLPPINVKAAEFAIGERFFGSVEAQFRRTPQGLYSDNILARDSTFEIVGAGGWRMNEFDPLGSQSTVTATLTSTDVVETMRRLNYQPGIVSDDMGILLDLTWSGGPRLDFLETVNGEVQVRLGSGQLDEVDPGAGRVFGLMSVVALPRRLSLDFRDVFDKGFGFDEINGTFRLENGVARTCNLGLEGPAADVAIIGSTDLVGKSYEQTAVVSGNVGDALPVVGAVVAGPQAAAALLIFSQIFKKPLQEVGQLYYDVSGSWDDPAIESTDADRFAERVDLAGCLAETE